VTDGFGGPPVSGLPPDGAVPRRAAPLPSRPWRAAARRRDQARNMPDADDNLDKVLAQVRAKCREAADELGRYFDAGLTATRELLAAF
jgi:hypothetical protein